jgi:pimeloyl-ACP methyl ester carboxylesterase
MLKTVLLAAASSYFAWYMERFELEMVYPFDAAYTTPAEAGEGRLAEARARMEDGTELILWQSTALPGHPTILYFPGNAGALKDRAERFSFLIDRGYGIVAVAYRGSSGSGGEPDENRLTKDALKIARSETGRQLVLYGESLGTALAVKIAAEGLGDAIVLEAPFTSVSDLLSAQYPREDLGNLLTQRWDVVDIAPSITQPLLIIHGKKDKIVPIELGKEMFERAGSVEKHFVEVQDRGHHELWTQDMRDTLFAFLDAR